MRKTDRMKKTIMKSPRKFALLSLVIFAFLAVFLAALIYTHSWHGYSGKKEKVIIGTPLLESSALIYVADRQGFFPGQRLNVQIKDYDTGASSLKGLLQGEVDIATPAEYALVGRAFQKEKICALASIDKVQYFFLIARKDRGIEKIDDLKGKRIGVVTKTTAEFYLGRFLELHRLKTNQVRLVNIDISQSADAIMKGDLDAIVSRPPYVIAIKERLGAKALTWPVQSSQALYAVMIGRDKWLKEHAESVKRLLAALSQAEEYIVHHPAEAKDIVQKRLNVDAAYLETVWSQNQFSLSLDQSLILAMEDEARWMIRNNLIKERKVPNFLDYISEEGLKAVKPGAVNIIR